MELILQKNEILDLGNGLLNFDITCLEGHCWLTQTGDNRDHILSGGHKFINRKPGHLFVTALEDCRLTLVSAENHKAVSPWKWLGCHS